MAFQRATPEEILERRRFWNKAEERPPEPPPAPRNVQGVLWLTDPFRVPYRGRMWIIPPVSFVDGARVLRIKTWLEQATEDEAKFRAEYLKTMREIMALIRRLVRPESGWFRRIRWRLRLMRNPWRTATHEEVGTILGFFWMRHTKDPDQLRISPRENPGLSIS